MLALYFRAKGSEKRAIERDIYSVQRLRPFFAGRDMAQLQRLHIRDYIDSRRANGVCNGTVNRELGLLSAAINFCKDELGWGILNPVQRMRQKEAPGRTRYLKPEEADRLISVAVDVPHLYDFLVLALNTGCRRGELLKLTWDRVNFENQTLNLEAMHTKTQRPRQLPLNKNALEALMRRRASMNATCPSSAYVFAHENGKAILSIKRSFSTACKRAGLSDFRIHDLRHTSASWMVGQGVPLTVVRDVLGHSTIRMTERYAHLAPHHLRDAVQSIESKSRFGHGKEESAKM